jgi:hypothetical protein
MQHRAELSEHHAAMEPGIVLNSRMQMLYVELPALRVPDQAILCIGRECIIRHQGLKTIMSTVFTGQGLKC